MSPTPASKNSIKLTNPTFYKALKSVVMPLDNKPLEQHPILKLVQFQTHNNKLIIMATDGYTVRMTYVTVNIPDELNHQTFYLDYDFAKQASKTPAKSPKHVLLQPNSDNSVTISEVDSDHRLQSWTDNLFQDPNKYPNVFKLFPKTDDIQAKFTIDAKELTNFCRHNLKPAVKVVDNHDVKLLISKHHNIYFGIHNPTCHQDPQCLASGHITSIDNSLKADDKSDFIYCIYLNVNRLLKILNHISRKSTLKFTLHKPLQGLYINDDANNFSLLEPLRPNF